MPPLASPTPPRPAAMPADFRAKPEWVDKYVKVGTIFALKWDPRVRFALTKIEADLIHAEVRWGDRAGMLVQCDASGAAPGQTPKESLFWTSEPTALQVGDGWQFTDTPDGTPPFAFVVTQMAWDDVYGWRWTLTVPSTGTTLVRMEDEILMRAAPYVQPAPLRVVARRGNAKCGCGSAAFQLLNAIECFNPNCRFYVPEVKS